MSNNIFGNLQTEGFEGEKDVLGGGGTVESGAYDGVVELAYVGKSQSSDAQNVTFNIKLDNGFYVRETIYVTNKKGENFYPDKNDAKKKHLLPGFLMVDSLCLLTTGLGLTDQEMEEKVVNLYDFEAKKELPKNVIVLTDVIGKPITVGVIKQIVDKNVKDSSGNYVPSGETREENVIDKAFHQESKRTVSEIRAGLDEAVFYPKWVEKNQGKPPRNRAKGAEGKTGAPGQPPAAGQAAKPKSSLFSS